MMIRVGCSSWLDPEFIKHWYPKEVRAEERLRWYSENFDYVEVNSSFYAVPERRNVAKWVEQTPDDFLFDAKLHKALSRHNALVETLPPSIRPKGHGLKSPVRIDRELERDLVLWTKEQFAPVIEAGKFGAFLLQLAPSFVPNRHRLTELEGLLEDLSPLPLAVELRNKGWLEGETAQHTIDFLSDYRATLVGVDTPDIEDAIAMPALDYVTNPDLAYLRLHGRNATGFVQGRTVAERFSWQYGEDELRGIVQRVEKLKGNARQVRVAANNNDKDYAPKAAKELRRMLGLPERKPRPTRLF
ncbi:Uncharacterized conserved protein YecE, DUF72 family [Verrucomicrobium sp. GAS474]|uniref:DUF72 domain-containing protein n=1 Tax=Verrucomicrobium sp. GAS474 TaxID=1882831 RepID=UPI000879C57A|nr:DUF72 domain-containing protein [Verrucomicrobium sp. GAS474]SDU13966.1 Uncharacterized conserved protein YecE, DUF72 family [Verrucomicrobium sp. GAS474]